MQAEKVQSSLLSQVRVVAKEQPIVARISKYSVVTFTTGKLFVNFVYLTKKIDENYYLIYFSDFSKSLTKRYELVEEISG